MTKAAMLDEQDAILDDLLIRWHQWRRGYTPSRGFNNAAAVTGENYRVSRQYDDANGALDEAIEAAIMRQVEFEIGELEPMHRDAIGLLALALVIGAKVFTNPRLPQDRAEREAVVRAARVELTRRLLSAGVM